jgi:aspartyl-tRNA(Asn)/glutamyl-tRNA(Gln) amidotransferase subunit B
VLHQETRGWDEKTGTTYSLRSKEEAQDYRYFPDPDLPPLLLTDAFVEAVRAGTSELPAAKRQRFVTGLGLTAKAAETLTQHPRIAAFFEDAATLSGEPQKTASFVLTEVLRDATSRGADIDLPITAVDVAGILALVKAETISGKQAKEVYARLRDDARAGERPASPEELVERLGMAQLSGDSAIEAVCRAVVLANPKQAAAFRAGKEALLGFFVGLVMKETSGSANPGKVNAALRRLLGSPS